MVTFPHANRHKLDDDLFLAYWLLWFAGGSSPGLLAHDGPVPRLNQAVGMETLVHNHYGHGLDALCRTIVDTPYRNTMHATNEFMDANARLVMKAKATNPRTGRTVNGAQLTPKALKRIGIIQKHQRLLASVELRIATNGPYRS